MAPRNPAIFTICSNNYVPMAKVLLASARAQHPDATCYLCLADRRLPDGLAYPQDCEIVPAAALDIPEFSHFAFRYDVLEFNTAVKPFMFLHLLQRGHDAVLYFDPDIEIFAPLDAVMQHLGDGASLVLTPHLLQPAEGDAEPDDLAIMRAGIYNLGFLAAGATAEAKAVLAWWARRLRDHCIRDQGNGLFVDQKFIDLVPGFAEKVVILRDSRYNAAYWNLRQRELTQDAGTWRVDGAGMVFFHFSGFDCSNTGRLSKHSRTFSGAAIFPALRALLQHYADRVAANGYLSARGIPYAYDYFTSGTRISYRERQVFRTQYAGWQGDPFTEFETGVLLREASLLPMKSAMDLHAELQGMHASTSWRITRPLRQLGRWLRGDFSARIGE